MKPVPANRQATFDVFNAYAGRTGRWMKRTSVVNTYDIGGQPVRVVSFHPKRPEWAKQVHNRLQAIFQHAQTDAPHEKNTNRICPL